MSNALQSTAADLPPEKSVWHGTPSQVLNLPQYLLWSAVLLVLLGIEALTWDSIQGLPAPVRWLIYLLTSVPVLIMAWKWLVLATTQFELTTQRLRMRTGVLNRQLEELELYRVRDSTLEQPLALRVFALSNINLVTSDKGDRVITLRAIRRGDGVREEIRTYVEECRMRRGVRELDID
jgi:uncharacterized membrane protein YdbT with pleckstrin-like domain